MCQSPLPSHFYCVPDGREVSCCCESDRGRSDNTGKISVVKRWARGCISSFLRNKPPWVPGTFSTFVNPAK